MKYLENIKAIRKAKGLTQQEMSDKIGMAKNNYGKVENGQIELTVSRLYQIADILEVSVIALLGESTEDSNVIAELKETNAHLTKKVEEIEENYNRTKEMFDAVWPFAKIFLKFFENVNPKTFIENPDRATLMEELEKKGFDFKDDSLKGLKIP